MADEEVKMSQAGQHITPDKGKKRKREIWPQVT